MSLDLRFLGRHVPSARNYRSAKISTTSLTGFLYKRKQWINERLSVFYAQHLNRNVFASVKAPAHSGGTTPSVTWLSTEFTGG